MSNKKLDKKYDEKSWQNEKERLINKYIESNKKRIVRAIFGRTFMVVMSVLLQIIVLLGLVTIFADYFFAYFIAITIFSFILIVHIANNDMNPAYKLAWAVPVAILPVFGAFLFLFTHIQPTTRKVGEKTCAMVNQTRPYMEQKDDVIESMTREDRDVAGLTSYMNGFGGGFPMYRNTDAVYFPLGENKFESMCADLENAKDYIFLEYFIVGWGVMLVKIVEILQRKAKEGVEIRFMYDGMCTLSTIPPDFPKYMRSHGINCQVYAPIRPALSTSQNHRDHRKILVIDGKIAYTGGVNLADEYINQKVRFGHWKDTAVRIEGDGVVSFTMMFLQMWNAAQSDDIDPKEEDYVRYIAEDNHIKNDGYVMGYGDSPYDDENVGEIVYQNIINNAERYVHIMTPYLILDNEMLKCLEYAAKRGVDIKIICPHITDKPSAYMIARTYYKKLIKAGIRIYEYTPGIVHAKVFSSDDIKVVVGTINMDFRSLYLNFECASFFYKHSVVKEVEEDYQKTLERCQEITLENCNQYSRLKLLIGKILWIFAPLM